MSFAMRMPRFIRALTVVITMTMTESCSFMRTAPIDPYGPTYDKMSTLIDETTRARASGADYGQWMRDHDMAGWIRDGSWDATLGEMYVRRASTLVRAAPVASLTDVWVTMASSDYRRRSDSSTCGYVSSLVLFVPLTLCVDVVIVPISLVASVVQDQMVDPEVRARAIEDLERARQLGVDRPLSW